MSISLNGKNFHHLKKEKFGLRFEEHWIARVLVGIFITAISCFFLISLKNEPHADNYETLPFAVFVSILAISFSALILGLFCLLYRSCIDIDVNQKIVKLVKGPLLPLFIKETYKFSEFKSITISKVYDADSDRKIQIIYTIKLSTFSGKHIKISELLSKDDAFIIASEVATQMSIELFKEDKTA